MPTGISVEIPKGYYGQIYTRSSLVMVGLCLEGGVIDAIYRGEIKLILWNRDPRSMIKIFKGDFIAQMVIHKIYTGGRFEEVKELSTTTRGTQGFGSTGARAVVMKKELSELKHDQQKSEKHGYHFGEKTTGEQKQQISELMHEFEDRLVTSFEEIQVSEPKFKHDIDTGDHPPIKRKPYRIPMAHREWQREENKRLEKSGVTRESNSPWSSATLLVPKKGAQPGKFTPRQVHDFRPLNEITKKDAYPMPMIDDIINMIEPGAK